MEQSITTSKTEIQEALRVYEAKPQLRIEADAKGTYLWSAQESWHFLFIQVIARAVKEPKLRNEQVKGTESRVEWCMPYRRETNQNLNNEWRIDINA
ncbi:hypothetical protein Tco_1568379 [Tanacetum coccineum]